MECNKEKIKVECACTYEPCGRKGKCCECVEYHRGHGEIPGCFFTAAAERTYDRSLANFLRTSRA